MTTRSTCGSWWPDPWERSVGLRKRAWFLYRKWTPTVCPADLASRAAGTQESSLQKPEWKLRTFESRLSHPNLLLVVPVRILSIINVPNFLSLSATRVTVLLLLKSCDLLCVGTEGGGVYFLEVPSLSLKDNQTLLQDQITHRWDCYTKEGINTKKTWTKRQPKYRSSIKSVYFSLSYTVKLKDLVDTPAKLMLEWNKLPYCLTVNTCGSLIFFLYCRYLLQNIKLSL